MSRDGIYDLAAFEAFCDDLIARGFSPTPGEGQLKWTGPVVAELTGAGKSTSMQIRFPAGWPLRYAKVRIEGLLAPHSDDGEPCLWADDDPAQVVGRYPYAYWARLDEWVSRFLRGFTADDLTLDAFLYFEPVDDQRRSLELPLGDIVRHASHGQLTFLTGTWHGGILSASRAEDGPLPGVLYYSTHPQTPVRALNDLRGSLTHHQRDDFDRRLDRQQSAKANSTTGPEFVVLAFPSGGRTDAVPVLFSGADRAESCSLRPTPSDESARRARAGRDSDGLRSKHVLVAGAGSVGGQVALALAEAGVGRLEVADSDILKTANLVRHVAGGEHVGRLKSEIAKSLISDHAPWCDVVASPKLPMFRSELEDRIGVVDLVVDCTGEFAMSAVLAEVCHQIGTPLILGAIYNNGSTIRVRRQALGDVPIAERSHGDSRYPAIPLVASEHDADILEVGCTSPVHASPAWVTLRAAAEISQYATDALLRLSLNDERLIDLSGTS